MRITVLGCGSAWSRHLGSTAFLVEQRDVKLVVDCGPTVPNAIDQCVGLDKVTHYFVSHIHGDHTGGLEEVAFKSYFLYKRQPILLVGQRLMPTLWSHYLAASLHNVLTPDGKQDMTMTLGSYFYLYQCAAGKWIELQGSGLFLALYEIKHVGSKVAYALLVRNHDSGKQVLFTCDVVAGNKLPYGEADLIFHDCSFSAKTPDTVHTHVVDLLELSSAVQQKVVCVHYADEVVERRPLLDTDIAPLRLATLGDQYEL